MCPKAHTWLFRSTPPLGSRTHRHGISLHAHRGHSSESGEQHRFDVPGEQRFECLGGRLRTSSHKSRPTYSVQFSMLRSWTRPNSPVLLVTSVSFRERACAAMKRSFAPIIAPLA